MKITKTLILTLGLAAILSACSDKNESVPTGIWKSAAPISASVADATSATKVLTVDFASPVDNQAAELTFTADYDVTAPVVADSVTTVVSYQVTATIKGTWTKESGSKDDYLLTFDRNSLVVNGVNAPELGSVTDDFLNSLAPFAKIEDVELTQNGSHMTFETNNPEVDYHFVRQ